MAETLSIILAEAHQTIRRQAATIWRLTEPITELERQLDDGQRARKRQATRSSKDQPKARPERYPFYAPFRQSKPGIDHDYIITGRIAFYRRPPR